MSSEKLAKRQKNVAEMALEKYPLTPTSIAEKKFSKNVARKTVKLMYRKVAWIQGESRRCPYYVVTGHQPATDDR
jgi:hypothetical protein